MIDLVAGETLTAPAEIANLLLTTRDGRPVYVSRRGAGGVRSGHIRRDRRQPDTGRGWQHHARPAVTLAIAKRAGANAVVVAEEVLHRVEALKAS